MARKNEAEKAAEAEALAMLENSLEESIKAENDVEDEGSLPASGFTGDVGTRQTVQVPSVGRMVHYVAWEPMEGDSRLHAVHFAATVTKVQVPGNPDSPLSLFVMAPHGTSNVSGAVHDEAFGAGTWHWPEFVPGIEVVAEEG